jgi:hypothetical protein
MKNFIKWFLIILGVVILLAWISTFFESDESKADNEFHKIVWAIESAQSETEIDSLFLKFDAFLKEHNDAGLAVKIDSIKQSKPVYIEKIEKEKRAKLEKQIEENKVNAFFAAKSFVEKRLKAPSTAKWPYSGDENVRINYSWEKGNYIVLLWVDAQNAFGAMLRNNFLVEVHQKDQSNWTLINIVEL